MEHRIFIIEPSIFVNPNRQTNKGIDILDGMIKLLNEGWEILNEANDGNGRIIYILCDTSPV